MREKRNAIFCLAILFAAFVIVSLGASTAFAAEDWRDARSRCVARYEPELRPQNRAAYKACIDAWYRAADLERRRSIYRNEHRGGQREYCLDRFWKCGGSYHQWCVASYQKCLATPSREPQ